MIPPSVAAACVLVDSLVAAGVVHFCVCPGNRSAPLAFALAGRPDVSTSVHVDERSAAFYALGHALRTGAPVVLVCTSGSAGAHFLPALVEADAAGIPLIAITADRPPELHDCGADQTMPQAAMFASYVRWAVDMEAPSGLPHEAAYFARIASRAVASAQGPRRGPVHINARYRDPLEPASGWQRPAAPPIAHVEGAGEVAYEVSDAVGSRLVSLLANRRVLCVAGPGSRDESLALYRIARSLGGVVLADPLSGLRNEPGEVATYDALLRSRSQLAALRPDVIVRTGAMPTSKAFRLWLEELGSVEQIVFDPERRWRDPGLRALTFVAAPAQALERVLAGMVPGHATQAWADAWTRADGAARAVLAATGLPDEAATMAAVLASLAPGDHLHVASSMPIRDLDLVATALPADVRVTANRGVNGIDGTISTALGIASARPAGRTVCVLGDVATLHDVGGLAAARGLRATFVVVNNGGGGIFGFLPAAGHADVFERFFLTPQHVELGRACEAFGVAWRATGPEGTAEAIASMRDLDGVAMVEVCCDREASRAGHLALWAAMARAGVEAIAASDSGLA